MKHSVKTSDIHGASYDVSVNELVWRPSAYAIVVRDGKVLLSKQHTKYQLPGGGVELGETPEEAVVREVYEETGFVVASPRLVEFKNTFFTWKDGKQEWHFQAMLFFYECKLVGGEASIQNMEPDEMLVSELPEWVPLDTLDVLPLGSTFDWLAVVRQVAQ